MPKILRPMDVYKYLPGTNCGKCGEANCMAFATKLIERQVSIEQCPEIFEPKYKDKLKAMLEVLRAPVKEVTIGVGERAVTIGGKVCVYRHELTWYHPTAIAIDVHDEMAEDELIKRVKQVEEFVFERIGMQLKLDMIALRCVSGNPEKFARTADLIAKNTSLPMILCSFDPNVMEEALLAVGSKKPLIYAATEKNWKEFAKLASKYECPLTVSAPGDLSMLKSLCRSLRNYGLDDLVLDPGTYPVGDAFGETVNMFTMLRISAIEKNDADIGYPLMAVPAAIWALSKDEDEANVKMQESYVSCVLMARYADLLVMHSMDPWVLLPVLVCRQNLYTDPRVPLAVDPGLYEVKEPDEMSPLYVTCNSALTYFLVKNDVEAAGSGWLLCVDTGGISLQSSVAGRRFTADMVAEAMKEFGALEKVKHKTVIIPGYAARISGELEDMLKDWKVYVGPRDSTAIPSFIEKVWKPEVSKK